MANIFGTEEATYKSAIFALSCEAPLSIYDTMDDSSSKFDACEINASTSTNGYLDFSTQSYSILSSSEESESESEEGSEDDSEDGDCEEHEGECGGEESYGWKFSMSGMNSLPVLKVSKDLEITGQIEVLRSITNYSDESILFPNLNNLQDLKSLFALCDSDGFDCSQHFLLKLRNNATQKELGFVMQSGNVQIPLAITKNMVISCAMVSEEFGDNEYRYVCAAIAGNQGSVDLNRIDLKSLKLKELKSFL